MYCYYIFQNACLQKNFGFGFLQVVNDITIEDKGKVVFHDR